MKEGHMALRIIKNEKLLCGGCLSSSNGPNSRAVYCHHYDDVPVKNKDTFCPHGLWLIDGQVVDFKTGFQMLYNKNQSIGRDKEIDSEEIDSEEIDE